MTFFGDIVCSVRGNEAAQVGQPKTDALASSGIETNFIGAIAGLAKGIGGGVRCLEIDLISLLIYLFFHLNIPDAFEGHRNDGRQVKS